MTSQDAAPPSIGPGTVIRFRPNVRIGRHDVSGNIGVVGSVHNYSCDPDRPKYEAWVAHILNGGLDDIVADLSIIVPDDSEDARDEARRLGLLS